MDGNHYNNLSKEDVYSLDKSKITDCKKNYIPKINGRVIAGEITKSLLIYTYDAILTPLDYISYYTAERYRFIYGDNAVDDDTIDLCNYFNSI